QSVATAGAAAPLDLHVVRPRRSRGEVERDTARETRDAFEPFVVQFVRDIGRTMVIVMAAGEESQHRNLFRIERGGVGGHVRVVLQDQIETCGNVALYNQTSPLAGGADTVQYQFVCAQAPDDVEGQL